MDLFDRVRTVIQQMQRPMLGGTLWMNEWDFVSDGIINIKGSNPLGGHCLKICGWTLHKRDGTLLPPLPNGRPYMCLQNSWGENYGDKGFYYMTPDVFNAAFSLSYGIGYWSDDPNATIVQLGFFLALLANLKAFYQTLIAQKSSFPPPTQFSPMILKWAQAIAKAEGAKSSLNNPGDLKVSTLTQSWGAGYGFQATDGGWIASFNTPQAGMNALCNFLKLGCENELIAFHSPEARTLGGFTQIFAGNPPPSYLEIITTELGVPADTQISTFL